VFKRILLPLDGSANAEGAIPWAIKYAAPSKTPVVLTRVLDKVYPLKGMPFGAEADQARVYLEAVADKLSQVGIPSEIMLPMDAVAPAIVSAAERAKCNLIVMTSRGSSRLIRRLVGGITDLVIRISSVPVLVARSPGSLPALPAPSRILVPVDGSPDSKHVLAWAERLAQFHHVPAELLYVRRRRTRSRATEERRAEEVSREATRLCGLLRKRGIAASYRLEEGDPAPEILKACGDTDLVVMTTHRRGGLQSLVKGSVAEKVIHGARGPVFVSKRGPGAKSLPGGPPSKEARPARAASGAPNGLKKN
jgi:nucleotide-binding universal stress UspA family protein